MTNKTIDDFTGITNSETTTQVLVQDSVTKVTGKMNVRRNGYEDLKPTGGHTPGGAANPATVNSFGIHEFLEFSGSTNKRLTNVFHLPHDYVEGTPVYMHVHHSPTNANPSGNVQFKIHCQYAQGYEYGAFSATDLTETLTADLTDVAQFTHIITEGGAIGDAEVGSVIRTDGIFVVTLERLASTDTSSDNEIFFEMDIHYQSDGTKTVNKNDTGTGFQKV